jgi:hypothetical protein
MKIIAIRFALAVLFVAALLFVPVPIPGQFSAALSGSLWAIVFAVAAIYLTGKARAFVLLTVFAATVLFPLIILCWIGLPFRHTWRDSAAAVLSSLYNNGPLWGFEIFIPLAIAAAIVGFLPRVIRAFPVEAP